MSITVANCLKLPSLREAKVLAGSRGLDKIVSAVTVLEYADYSVIVDTLFVGNEVVISGFVNVKQDVGEQCKVLRRLSEVGEVALILYYVGIFVPYVDQKLLDIADELDFPLICMPKNRFDFRYSDAISEINELIIKDRMKDIHFVSGIIERVSQLQERQQTVESILRLLSDYLHCTLLFCDSMYKLHSFAAWPISTRWDYQKILDEFKTSCPSSIMLNGNEIYISSVFVALGDSNMKLISIDETGMLKHSDLKQSAEVIQWFSKIWNIQFREEDTAALVQAILNDNPIRMRQLASLLHFNIEAINIMWILKETEKGITSDELHNRNIRRIKRTKLFLQGRQNILINVFEDNVLVFMSSAVYNELDKGIAEAYIEFLKRNDQSCILIVNSNLKTTADVRAAYNFMESNFEVAMLIYPIHEILSSSELLFAQNCIAFVQQGEQITGKLIGLLNPLLDQEDSADLIKTLSVFLIDSQKNMEETGNRMFLHKNTVKYRINKIKHRLGYDISKEPDTYHLYMAVALKRLLEGLEK